MFYEEDRQECLASHFHQQRTVDYGNYLELLVNSCYLKEEFGIANGTTVEKKRGRKKGVPNKKKKKTGQPAPKRKILQKKNNTTNGDSMAAVSDRLLKCLKNDSVCSRFLYCPAFY